MDGQTSSQCRNWNRVWWGVGMDLTLVGVSNLGELCVQGGAYCLFQYQQGVKNEHPSRCANAFTARTS